jgi:hypothetical protein
VVRRGLNAETLAAWLLEQEARALLVRLRRVRPFSLQETMVPAAAITPAAHVAIEAFLVRGRLELGRQVREYIRWLQGPGRAASPALMQRRFALIRVRFNEVLSQFDLFSDVITQRSEHEIGVFPSALDSLASEALEIPGRPFEKPEVVCYLDRGPGAAIRRARTRIDGGETPVAVVRVPRERMVGFGLGASMLHECGHQAAALLELLPSLRPLLQGFQRSGAPRERAAWLLWERWISEIVADFWAVGKLGISGSLGLMSVISLPPYFVFRANLDDPHPIPWMRLKVSAALGDALYPNRQWRELVALWERLYPPTWLPGGQRALLRILETTLPGLVGLIVNHRPRSLGGRSLREVMPVAERSPERLRILYRTWRRQPRLMREAAPSLALAVLGQARATAAIGPEAESRALRSLLTYWALQSSVRLAEAAAGAGDRNGARHRFAPLTT